MQTELIEPYKTAYDIWLKDCYTDAMSKWVEENPYMVYSCSYDEQISDEQAGMILAGEIDSFWESMDEWEMNAYDYAEWSCWESEFATEFDFDSWEDIPEEIQEAAQQERLVNCSDLFDAAIRNKTVHVVAIPKDVNGEYFEAPNWQFDRDTNAQIIRNLRKVFGIKYPWKIESMYTDESMKVCGTLDLQDIIKNGTPTHIKIGPNDCDQILFHTSSCGAGCLGSTVPTKEVILPADFVNDEGNRYGVDAVYGMCGSFWREELTAIRIEPEKTT